jgi:SAM-dependent methyltransferase
MAEKHFYEQKEYTTSYLLNYFQKHLPGFENFKILEIGCAEGGFLDVLYESNIEAIGVELEPGRVKLAKDTNPNLNILVGDITEDNIIKKIGTTFDLVVMRDVIEHIPDRESTFSNISKLLKKNGFLYITFPPRFSGFAGHQQNGKSILRMTPFLHLFPDWIIRFLGKVFKERSSLIENVILNYKVGLTIGSFEKYYSIHNFQSIIKELFLIRPIFKIRFNMSLRKIPNIPIIREFLALGCEYLLKKNK